ncbi:bifunctional riboflavin kinase/FAD synthetase [Lyngbya confervoides]|uniref:Riboflavin biosynthesis protein n=1 Tax=Lyngbya confervoides BDU141951 TaxID=1574623 RepID=A0ABD4T427_9CYAN|nr:bifunctional riboflavin kinase/FAD synthetase [Lyngbya confervoides]MCM1983203.1 bifunctional riboflavin kinase/FAD synthetase [Lyngbya confervoides BDU141951]
MWVTSSLNQVLQPTAAALGNFDGLHLGHQRVIQAIQSASAENIYPTVVAFDPHPHEYFSGQMRQLLTPVQEKATLLQALGVAQLVLLPFNQRIASLTPEAFVRDILITRLRVQQLSVGFNFHFGRDRSGNPDLLVELGQRFGIQVHVADPHRLAGEPVSSSLIRTALETGDLTRANQLLGRSYALTGTVVHGEALGRTLGFPTANVEVPGNKFLPRYGVYRVSVQLGQDPQRYGGVMNLGDRPTVNGQHHSIEVHLLDWSGDLYGQTLTVSLQQFLRPEQKFSSLAELQAQIQRDCDTARAQLTSV